MKASLDITSFPPPCQGFGNYSLMLIKVANPISRTQNLMLKLNETVELSFSFVLHLRKL